MLFRILADSVCQNKFVAAFTISSPYLSAKIFVVVGMTRKGSNIEVLQGKTKITYVRADGYSGVGLKCDLKNITNAVWMRNGVDVDFDVANGLSVS